MTAMISDSSPEAGGRTKPRERPGGRQVLHGRAAEQRMVRDLLRRARRGAGGVVLVEGDRVPAGPGCSETPPTTQRSWAFRWPRGRRTSWARRSRSSRCARPCACRSPNSSAMIPVTICPPRPRGGLARYEHTSHSAPRRRRSWSAWMTCTGPCGGHAGRAAGVAAGHQTAPGRLAPGTVKHAPPRHGVPVRSTGAGRCRPAHVGPAGSRRGSGHAHRRVRCTAGPGPGRPGR